MHYAFRTNHLWVSLIHAFLRLFVNILLHFEQLLLGNLAVTSSPCCQRLELFLIKLLLENVKSWGRSDSSICRWHEKAVTFIIPSAQYDVVQVFRSGCLFSV